MNRYVALGVCGALLAVSAVSREAAAQGNAEMVEHHMAAAKAATYRPGFDFSNVFESVCPLPDRDSDDLTAGTVYFPNDDINVRTSWFVESEQVFDNLYFVGSVRDSMWAVTTSDGIILINTGSAGIIGPLVTEGFARLGLDPTQIKYAIVTHGHSAIYPGAKFLQETYGTRIIMGEKDWDIIARNTDPEEYKGRKDMIATDGMELTLGDTTIRIFIIPGHSPETLALLVPLKDGRNRHLGSLVGGQGWGVGRSGVQYWRDEVDAITVWRDSLMRWRNITAQEGADVFMALHPMHSLLFTQIQAVKYRRPGIDPHPFVNRQAVQDHATIIIECMQAQLAARGVVSSD